MDRRILALMIFAAALAAFVPLQAIGAGGSYLDEFNLSERKLLPTGRSDYFILEPGFQMVLQGGDMKLQITVLDQTRRVNGVETRVVEEREWKKGKLYEVARNFFAICEKTKDVFYFGEEVDFYDEKGNITRHDGTWLAGVNGNKPGLIMPGSPKVKMKYYQEVAPGVAMDRAEIVSLNETCQTPAGKFKRCLKVLETSAIDATAKEYKYHAPGVGLVRDEDLRLVKYGFAGKVH